MFSRINSCVTLLLLVFTIGCKTQKNTPSIISENIAVAPVSKNTGAYLIRTGNNLLVQNLNWSSQLFPDPNKSAASSTNNTGYTTQVNVEGNITMPEIGKIHAAGLTIQQLSDTLSERYKDIIQTPVFDIKITNLHAKVLGACTIQGLVTLDIETQSLGEVLAKAGGIKFSEAGNTIQIIRGDGKVQKIIEYDFQQLGNPAIMNLPVFDRDIVYIPPSREGVRSVRLSRKLVILQPVLIALNLALLIVNITR